MNRFECIVLVLAIIFVAIFLVSVSKDNGIKLKESDIVFEGTMFVNKPDYTCYYTDDDVFICKLKGIK